jgi:nucleoside-diphosphate-sugar epimerase
MKVVLTGATGFVGSHVARRLVQEGCDVYAPVRPGGHRWRLDGIASRLNVFDGEVCDPSFVECVRSIRPELCVHCAWYASAPDYLSSPHNVPFVDATLRMSAALSEAGCKRFVGVGTCFEYDTACGYLSEGTRIAPKHLYSACKAATWLVLEQLARQSAMSVAWARLFFVYGPLESERRLIPSVVRALLAGQEAKVTAGEQVRDFVHVEDVASAIWAIARSATQGAVNVGSAIPVSVRQVVKSIGASVGQEQLVRIGALPYPPDDPPFVCADNTRLKACGWTPRYDLEEGISQAVAWWRQRVTGL